MHPTQSGFESEPPENLEKIEKKNSENQSVYRKKDLTAIRVDVPEIKKGMSIITVETDGDYQQNP